MDVFGLSVHAILLIAILGETFCAVNISYDTGYMYDVNVSETQEAAKANVTRDFTLIYPVDRLHIFMETERIFQLNFNMSCESDLFMSFQSEREDIFSVKGENVFSISCGLHDAVVGMAKDSLHAHAAEQPDLSVTITIAIAGNRLGVSDLLISLHSAAIAASASEQRPGRNNTQPVLAKQIIPVAVLRNIRAFDRIFLVVISVFIVIVMIGFGCKLDMEVVKECIKKPLAPGIGFGCQYLVMPLLGFTLASVVPTGDRGVTLGIFLCGICPGGGVSNIYTYLLDGDVSLSITMTFFSTLAAIGMMPFWIYTLGRRFTADDLTIPYIDMLQTTAMVTVSLLVGIGIKYKCHKIAALFIKILKPVTFILVIALVSIGIYSNLYIFKLFQPIHFIAGCLLPYCGYVIGGTVAALVRLPWARIKTVAIETGLQNIGIAFILLKKSFPPPYNDIAAIAPAASGLMTPLPLLFLSIVYLIYKRCTGKYREVKQNPEDEKSNIQNGTADEKCVVEKLSTV